MIDTVYVVVEGLKAGFGGIVGAISGVGTAVMLFALLRVFCC